MSEKNLDKKGRWRSVTVGFRVSKEEAEEINMQVALSGLPKQEYILKCLTDRKIRVVCGRKVAREMKVYLEAIISELQYLAEDIVPGDEIWVPLKHILEILNAEEGEGYE